MKRRYGSGLTPKQRRQAELYHEFMKQHNPKKLAEQRAAESQPEDLFAKKPPAARHEEKSCSVCGSNWAWHSVDSGETWQCAAHKVR